MPTSPNNIQQYPTFLTKVKLCPTSSNNTQHHPTMPNMGGQTIPTFIPNIVGICWAKMLASFGQGFRISMLLVFLYMALSVHCSDFSCSYLAMVAHFQFSINQHCLCLDSYEFDLCKLLKFCISSHLKSGR